MGKRNPKQEQHWRGVIEQYAASGQTAAAFCREREIRVWQFYWWRRRLLGVRDGASSAPDASGFVELLGPPAARGGGSVSGVSLRLAGGLIVVLERGFDPDTLRLVLAAVAGTGA